MRQYRLSMFVGSAFLFSILSLFFLYEGKAFAKCDAELARLNQAQANLNAANAAYDAAKKAYDAANAQMQQAVANLNAVAQKLGASGQATTQSATFGRPPSNPAFFDNPDYKAAKQSWQNAKGALGRAEGDVDVTGRERMRAQDDYDAAKKAYDECMARRRDDEYLREPEPLKLDEGLQEKVWKDRVGVGDTASDIEYRLRKEREKTFMDVSILTHSPQAQYARWMPENPSLHLASAAVLPAKTNPVYTQVYITRPVRSSRTNSQAPLLLGSTMGSLFGGNQSTTSNDPNCPTGATNQSGSSGFSPSGLGLGLLGSRSSSSQPTQQTVVMSEPIGLTASFDVTGREKDLAKGLLKTNIVNKDTRESLPLTMPIRLDSTSID